MKTHYDIDWLLQKYESDDTLKFIFFWGHINKYNEEVGKSCFSQWFPSPFVVDDITYKTAEHWMMASKALLFGDQDTFEKIIRCDKPGEAKELETVGILGWMDIVRCPVFGIPNRREPIYPLVQEHNISLISLPA
ncbi:NADAR family protein [Sphingobacterium sp. LRF_L2]|uniref:NADAR family protein n=1 Tax=Sphingobacterium sp. LRF_L2 TaxID=3369421 RepID=UPI003F60E237